MEKSIFLSYDNPDNLTSAITPYRLYLSGQISHQEYLNLRYPPEDEPELSFFISGISSQNPSDCKSISSSG